MQADSFGVREAENCTFETSQNINAILSPADIGEVQSCIEIANKNSIPIYPVSCGKNWGFGSRVPCTSGSAIVELSRMDQIVDFSEELGYVRIQPGVTFEMLSKYLQQQTSKWFTSPTGGPPDGSVLGNYLDRGLGPGPLGNRVGNACAMEIVMGNGQVVKTGFSTFESSKNSQTSAEGFGPSLDSLFQQSNLGIVTEMTLWLSPTPEVFESIFLTFNSETQFLEGLENLRRLQQQRVLLPCSLVFWNKYKLVSTRFNHPGGEVPLDIDAMLGEIRKSLRGCQWVATGAIYSGSKKIARAQRALVKKSFRHKCQTFTVLSSRRNRLIELFNKLPRFLRPRNIPTNEELAALFKNSPFLGFTTTNSVLSAYWRKPTISKDDVNPDRDRCGFIWLAHAVPFSGKEIAKATNIAEKTVLADGFEPQIGLIPVSSRSTRLVVAIAYDRDQPHADSAARRCHDKLFSLLNENGFTCCRLGIQSMDIAPQRSAAYEQLQADIKTATDPNGILAPGRYTALKR